jgi:tetratricopeptide (TPR) repeat protein
MIAAAFLPLVHAQFIIYDDQAFVTDNKVVQQGMTWTGIKTAFTSLPFHLYMPVTLLSHMLDCQFFGLDPLGHHLTSVVLHGLNTVLLFFLLVRMTGAPWRSWAVAALFAIHPMHVEAVAWIAERKELLSGLFGLLALCAYTRYARAPRRRTMALVFLWMLLGLLCKPMLVTLPCLLLLIDVWPLGRLHPFEAQPPPSHSPGEPHGHPPRGMGLGVRFRPGWLRELKPLLVEKLPLFGLSAALSLSSVITNKLGGSLDSLEFLPMSARIGNALYAYGQYLAKLFVPVGMTVFYPHELMNLPWWMAILSAILLLLITLFFLHIAGHQPYFLVGWLWFLGMLVPVIGLIQVGSLQSYADRYTYFTYTGLFMALVWGAADAARRWGRRSVRMGAGILALLLILLGCQTFLQSTTWRDTETVFTHSLKVKPEGNYVALCLLGMERYHKGGDLDGAKELLKKSIMARGGYYVSWYTLGVILVQQEKFPEAAACFQQARLRGGEADRGVHGSLARCYMEMGQDRRALVYANRAIELSPGEPIPYLIKANALMGLGKFQEAERVLGQALEANPGNRWLLADLSGALAGQHRMEEAASFAAQAVEKGHGDPRIYYELARTLMDAARVEPQAGVQAQKMAEQSVARSRGKVPLYLMTWGDALAASGRMEEARAQWEKALAIYRAAGNDDRVSRLEADLGSATDRGSIRNHGTPR